MVLHRPFEPARPGKWNRPGKHEDVFSVLRGTNRQHSDCPLPDRIKRANFIARFFHPFHPEFVLLRLVPQVCGAGANPPRTTAVPAASARIRPPTQPTP